MLTSPDPVSFPGYEVSVLLMVTSVLIEMTAEPLFIYAQIKSRFTVRIIAETLALLIRCLCLLTFLLIHSGNDDADDATTTTTVVKDGSGGAAASGERSGSNILMAFAGGQVAGSVCYTAVFWIHFYRQPNFPTHAFRPTIPLVSTITHDSPLSLPSLCDRVLIVTPLIHRSLIRKEPIFGRKEDVDRERMENNYNCMERAALQQTRRLRPPSLVSVARGPDNLILHSIPSCSFLPTFGFWQPSLTLLSD